LILACFAFSVPFMTWLIGRRVWLLGNLRGYITPGDLFEDRYKSKALKVITAVIGVAALFPYCTIQFVAIGKVLSSVTEGAISYSSAVIFLTLLTAFYTFLGGIRAIILTDMIQGTIFLVVLMLGAYVSLTEAGGLVEGLENAIAARPEAFVFDT